RVPQSGVQRVEVHVARCVAGELGIPPLYGLPAQEAGKSGLSRAFGEVLEEAVQIDHPAEVDLARGERRHLPVEAGGGFESVVDDVPDACVTPAEHSLALVARPEVVEPGEGALDER